MKRFNKLFIFVIFLVLSASLNAESLDYIGFTTGFDVSGKTTVFADGNVWESKSASIDAFMDLLVYFNNENSNIRYGTGFSIGCGFPVIYGTSYGEVDGKKPFACYGKVTGEIAFFVNSKTALESKGGFAIRVDQLDFNKNYEELNLDAPTRVINTSIMGIVGLSVRHEVKQGIVIRGGMDVSTSLLEYIDAIQGPTIINNYMGMHKGSRISVMPYLSLLFSY